MPEPTKIPRPFADSGDKNTIPESSGALGFASWQEGFPAITGTPFAQGGVAPKRADFNGIFNALSLATVWQQQGGFYAYDATTDYEVGNVVEYNNDLYKCITANGPSSAVKAPTDTTVWSKVMTAADAAALYLPLSGGTLTGTLYTKDVYFNNAAIRASTDSQNLNVYGGTGYLHGAYILLNGKDSSSNPGRFYIRADNGITSKALIGDTDGTFRWDNKDIATIQTGTWTPELYGATTDGAFKYNGRTAFYIKIGNLVYVTLWLNVTCTSLPAGEVRIKGFPFVSTYVAQTLCASSYGFSGFQLVNSGIYGMLLRCNTNGYNLHAIFSTSSNMGENVLCNVGTNFPIFVTGCYTV